MLEKEYIDSWYTSFAAGAVLISIPIAALFPVHAEILRRRTFRSRQRLEMLQMLLPEVLQYIA